MKTMNDEYQDESNHRVCEQCGMCIDCGDCKKLGCGSESHGKASCKGESE